jgi:hypothetical protein
MAALLSAQTTSTGLSGAGTATTAVESLIEIPNDSVFDGAEVVIQASSADTAAKFGPIDRIGTIGQPKSFVIRLPIGHFVRAVLSRAGASPSVSVNLLDVV